MCSWLALCTLLTPVALTHSMTRRSTVTPSMVSLLYLLLTNSHFTKVMSLGLNLWGKTPYISHSCSLGNDNFVICYQTSISVCIFNSMELPIKQRNSLNLKQFQYKAPTYLVAKKSIQCMLVSFLTFGLTLQRKTTFAKVGLVYFLTFY